MKPEQVLPATKVVNMLFAKPALVLLGLLHIQPGDLQYPIPNYLAMEIIFLAVAAIFFLWLKARMSADRPGGRTSDGIGAHQLHGSRHPGSIGRHRRARCGEARRDHGDDRAIHLGLEPDVVDSGFMSPTADKVVPLGCATIVFLYYNTLGIGRHGAGGYAKTLLGPVPAISPIMFVVETVSHFALTALAHSPALGQHDGERTDLRFIFRTFGRPLRVSGRERVPSGIFRWWCQ